MVRRGPERSGSAWRTVALAPAVLLVVVPPLVVVPGLEDAFALPKLMAAETLALATVLVLTSRLVGPVRIRGLVELRAIRAVVPLVAVATLGLALTAHPVRVGATLLDLWIATLFLVGCAVGFSSRELRHLVDLAVLPGVVLAIVAILQFHDLFEPFAFATGGDGPRLQLTSLAGATGDLAAYLAFACIVAQAALADESRDRVRWLAALCTCAYGLAVTQTLTALVAVAVASALLWAVVLPRRQLGRLAVGLAVVVVALAAAVAPLRVRIVAATEAAVTGRHAELLSGRLDGWLAATWMLREHPWTGVGLGAYASEFSTAKLALLAEGHEPYAGHRYPTFRHAHSDYLEVAAELGWPGLVALAWAMLQVGAAALAGTRGDRRGRALAIGGVTLWAVLAVAHFPFRLALTGYAALVFVGWILARERAS